MLKANQHLLFPFLLSGSSEIIHHWLMIGTIKVIFIRWSICKHRRRRVLEALHTSVPACLRGWLVAILCQNLTTNQRAMKSRETVCAETSDMSKMQKRQKACFAPLTICSFLIIHSQKTRVCPARFIYLCLLPSYATCNCHTHTALTSVTK